MSGQQLNVLRFKRNAAVCDFYGQPESIRSFALEMICIKETESSATLIDDSDIALIMSTSIKDYRFKSFFFSLEEVRIKKAGETEICQF